jgi:hypothetical protein
MPEAAAVLLVGVVSLLVYVIARVQARNPSFHAPQVRLAQLNQQHAWLQSRLQLAQRENWGEEMRRQITEELAETEHRRAQLRAS